MSGARVSTCALLKTVTMLIKLEPTKRTMRQTVEMRQAAEETS